MFTQSSGRVVASAMLLIPMLDELLASTAPAGASLSSSANIARLMPRSSNTASMTKSAPRVASARSVVVCTRLSTVSASAAASFPFSTRRIRWPRFESTAVWRRSSLVSLSATSSPCSAACCAIWAPIEPAPITDRRCTRSTREIEDFVRYSLDGKDSRHPVQGQHVGEQAVDLELALQQLGRHTPPNPVVIDGQSEQPDLEVAKAHHRVGVGADGEGALRLEAVVDDELTALEVERDSFIDVRHEDADARHQ